MFGTVGESQRVLIMIDPIISTRTRVTSLCMRPFGARSCRRLCHRRACSCANTYQVWSWAADSNPRLGRKQDTWKPYPLASSGLLENAIATGNTRVVLPGGSHHVELEGWEVTGAWQVVSADPPPGRRRCARGLGVSSLSS
eukprot:COSAG01_NODE_1645_length_9639_cov_14.725786_9_plen_141_part_00